MVRDGCKQPNLQLTPPSLDWQRGLATVLCDDHKLVPKLLALMLAGMIHLQAVELVKAITLAPKAGV